MSRTSPSTAAGRSRSRMVSWSATRLTQRLPRPAYCWPAARRWQHDDTDDEQCTRRACDAATPAAPGPGRNWLADLDDDAEPEHPVSCWSPGHLQTACRPDAGRDPG